MDKEGAKAERGYPGPTQGVQNTMTDNVLTISTQKAPTLPLYAQDIPIKVNKLS